MIFLRAAEMERAFEAIENWRTETESLGEGGARDNWDEGFNKTRANSHGEVRASEARSGLLPFILGTVLGRGGSRGVAVSGLSEDRKSAQNGSPGRGQQPRELGPSPSPHPQPVLASRVCRVPPGTARKKLRQVP